MGSILAFPFALIQGSLNGVFQSSLVLGSTDLAGIFADVVDGALGSAYSAS